MREERKPPSTMRSLAAGLVAAGLAIFVRAIFLDPLGVRAPWITFYPAVVLAALVGGFPGGAMATFASCVAVAWAWPAMGHPPFLVSGSDWLLMLVFLAVGLVVSWITGALLHARKRGEATLEALREREAQLRGFLDSVPFPVFLKDREGRYLLGSRAAFAVLGKTAAESIGKTDSELLGGPNGDAIRRNDLRVLESGLTQVMDEPVLTPNGLHVFHSTKAPFHDAEGRIVGVVGSAVDISDRKRTEEVLAFLAQPVQSGAGQAFFRDLAAFLARQLDMHFVCIDRLEGDGLTAQTLAVWCNGAFQDDVSYALKDTPCGDVVGKEVCCFPASVCQFFPRDAVLQELSAESYVGVTLWSHQGEPIGLIAVIGRSPLPDPAIAASVLKMVSSRASTELERMEAERRLRESEEHFRKHFEDHAAIELIVDPDSGRIVDANGSAARFYGWSRDRLREMHIQQINTLSADEVQREMEAARAARRERFEFRHRRADGSIRDVDVYSSRIDTHGRPLLHSIIHDNSARKDAERKLRESEERYRLVVENMAEGLLLQGLDGSTTAVNPMAERILGLGLGELCALRGAFPLGDAVREDGSRFPSEDHPPSVVLRTARPQTDVVLGLRGQGGGLTWIRMSSRPLLDTGGGLRSVVSTFTDITAAKAAEAERKEIQAKLANAARLASMGTLVAGVAHEINNPLAAEISGQGLALDVVRETRRRLEAGGRIDAEALRRALDEVTEALTDAQEGGQRIARIVRDMAAFAKPDSRRSPVRLADVVTDALRWVPPALLGGCPVKVEDLGAPTVVASAGQIQQVVVNLLTNAAKAQPPGTRRPIVVRTGTDGSGAAYLEVVDQGIGVDPVIRDRIFDPFFTTRPVGDGRGSGLGLAVSHAIATSHGGSLTFNSEPGTGSTFRLELPAALVEA